MRTVQRGQGQYVDHRQVDVHQRRKLEQPARVAPRNLGAHLRRVAGKEAGRGWGVGSVEDEGKQGYESWRRAWPWPLQPGSWLQRVT